MPVRNACGLAVSGENCKTDWKVCHSIQSLEWKMIGDIDLSGLVYALLALLGILSLIPVLIAAAVGAWNGGMILTMSIWRGTFAGALVGAGFGLLGALISAGFGALLILSGFFPQNLVAMFVAYLLFPILTTLCACAFTKAVVRQISKAG